ncbi:NADAR family protein [Ramlibacter sp.]|uniref:NADAR family protein n=1 Tax=Ramlibacter sp. TaxID=1917967 RepID=UPI0035B1DB94
MELHGLDTEHEVFFYEQEFYVLSNFSAFSLMWQGHRFPTSEHAYHWEKFSPGQTDGKVDVRAEILNARSAHDAFKMGRQWGSLRRPDWDEVKVEVMRGILRAKADQHEYVRRKLLATGDRTLIENSWRDDFWGWGPNRDGQNMLGRLWMALRTELRAQASPQDT